MMFFILQISSVEREYAELAAQNESESREVDALFAEKQARVQQIEQVRHRAGAGSKFLGFVLRQVVDIKLEPRWIS